MAPGMEMSIERILCPVDFSDYSQHALDCAVFLARRFAARVIALHVFTSWPAVNAIPSLAKHVGSLMAIDRNALLRVLQDVAQRSATAGEIVTKVVEAPVVHREILAQAESLRADLLVIGSHGRSGFERAVLGSITEKVMRKASCPVMVVPPQLDGAPERGHVQFKHVLCALDFSDSSEAAFAYAATIAEAASGHLTLVHVVEIAPLLFEANGVDVGPFRVAAEAARARLSSLTPVAMRSLDVVDTVVSEGRPWREILRIAAERRADLIVMGAEGRGAMDLRMFGSNTHDVVRGAVCPVLSVRGRRSD